jgi:MYXO-CTERM domain-containing protein
MSTKLQLTSNVLAGLGLSALAFTAPLVSGLAISTDAQACGGNFCDTGPTAMPVDQTGENILFRIGPDSVEAHIQIQIDPETTAEKFAWIIPVTALPEFEVGSQILFDNMLNGSVPSYGVNNQTDFCGEDTFGTGGDDGDPGGETGSEAEGDGDGDGDSNNPEVVFQDSVGAFEIAVLDGGTVEGVMQWLGDNGYQQDPNAEPIIEQYLAEDFLFVALKFGVNQGIADVHPIVIKYAGTEACVPIRLTAIAAAEDMDIRTFFLGDARTVPINYRHVLVNPLKLDWFNNASNYKEVISMAVDAEQAEGNAFVTEYAGTSTVISLAGVYDPSWDQAPIAALMASPVGLYDVLAAQNLMFCDVEWDQTCTTLHPLLQPLLDQYVPVPEGVDPVLFWTSMADYAGMIDLVAWNAAEFAAAFDERIVQPGLNATELVAANPYLTRMYTTISPAEMGADPMFRQNPTLPEIQSLQMATQTLGCDGGTTVELPDGRSIYFPAGDPLTWPDFQDEMPWDEDIDQEGMADGAPLINLSDKSEEIDALLDEWNKNKGADGDDDEGGNDDPGADDLGETGCSCTVDDRNPLGGLLFGFAALGLLGLVRRRAI